MSTVLFDSLKYVFCQDICRLRSSEFFNTNFITMNVYKYVYMDFLYNQKNLFIFPYFRTHVIRSSLEDWLWVEESLEFKNW